MKTLVSPGRRTRPFWREARRWVSGASVNSSSGDSYITITATLKDNPTGLSESLSLSLSTTEAKELVETLNRQLDWCERQAKLLGRDHTLDCTELHT